MLSHVVGPDGLMQLRDGVVLEPEPDVDRRRQIDAVLGDGVVGVGRGLQPQVIEEQLVPRQQHAHALVLQQARVELRAAAEPLPQNSDMAGRHRHDHVRRDQEADQRRHHQIDDDDRQAVLEEPPPPVALRRRLPIQRFRMRFHQPVSTELSSVKRPSSMRRRRIGTSISSI